MRTIQEVGLEILTNNPKSLYVFAGPEYGIKRKYLNALENHYSERVELPTVSDLINLMSTRHLIPLAPTLYVIRYDDSFVAELNDASANRLKSLKIVGTAVLVYDNAKQYSRLEKYLSDITVNIDKVDTRYVSRYLQQDYPTVPARIDNLIASSVPDYSRCDNIGRALSCLPDSCVNSISNDELLYAFGVSTQFSDEKFRKAVAARNFKYCMALLDIQPISSDSLLYTILSTMIELDKVLSNKYTNSALREYEKCWTPRDVYNMFQHTYHELIQIRKTNQSPLLSLIYLLGLTQFQYVPEWRVINDI